MFLKSKNYRKSYLKSILFILPGVVLTVVFVIYPVINTAWLSLNNWNGIGGAPVTWVGLENYIKVLRSALARSGGFQRTQRNRRTQESRTASISRRKFIIHNA